MNKGFVPILIAVLLALVGAGVVLSVQSKQSNKFGATSETRQWIPTSTSQTGIVIPNSYRPANYNNVYVVGSATTTNAFGIESQASRGCAEFNALGQVVGIGTNCITSAGIGMSGAWQSLSGNILTPTSSGAGILVNAASSTITNLTSNYSTTSQIIISSGTASSTIHLQKASQNAYILLNGNDNLEITTNENTKQLVLLPNNKVGIGTDNPISSLDVIGDMSVGGGIYPLSTNAYSLGSGISQWDTLYLGVAGAIYFNNGDASIVFADSADTMTFYNASGGYIFTGNTKTTGNATTSGYMVIGTTNPTINMQAGDLLMKRATTTNLAVTSMGGGGGDVKVAANGSLYEGVDANTGGGGGAAWESVSTTAIKPTTTGVGILVNAASSTITSLNSETFYASDRITLPPPYTFINDTNTGFSANGSDSIKVVTNGAATLTIGSTYAISCGAGSIGSCYLLQGSGTASAPNYTFNGDTDTGLYRLSADILGITSNGITSAIFSNSSSTITTNLQISGNATTSGYLVIGTTNPTINMQAGDLLMTRATTTSLAVTSLSQATCDVKAMTNGSLYCGTDSVGGIQNGAWQALWTNTLAPTNTSAGIFVYASSTFQSNLRIASSTDQNAALFVNSTTGNVGIGTTTPPFTLTVQGKAETNPFQISSSTGSALLTVNQKGQILAPLGSVSLPTYSFIGDPDTGIYSYNPNQISLVVGGNQAIYISEALQVRIDGIGASLYSNVSWNGFALQTNNTAAMPTYSWTTNGTVGMFRAGTSTEDSIGFSTETIERMRINYLGNVGIATSTPGGTYGEKLTVVGNSYFTGGVTTTALAVSGVATNNLVVTDANSTFVGAGSFSNGQLWIGDGDGIPTKATLTGAGGLTVTNGAGSITLTGAAAGTNGSWQATTTPGFLPNTYTPTSTPASIKLDGNATTSSIDITNGAHGLRIKPGATTTLEFY